MKKETFRSLLSRKGKRWKGEGKGDWIVTGAGRSDL